MYSVVKAHDPTTPRIEEYTSLEASTLHPKKSRRKVHKELVTEDRARE